MGDSLPAKTIQIFLPTGQPRGIRIAEITTRIIQAVSVPRNQVETILARPESQHVAVYLLFGQPADSPKAKVYIGQTEDLRKRLKQHDNDGKKDFWQSAVFIISRTHSFTQAHIRYLEWYFIKMATEAGRYSLENGNASSEPFVTEPMKADLMDAYETASALLGTLGHPLFEPLVSAVPSAQRPILYLKGLAAAGTGEWTEDGMVVLKGSRCRRNITASAKGTFVENTHKRLLQEGVMKAEGDQLVFLDNYVFDTPSGAAVVILGRSSNGWQEWKDASGTSLSDLRRKAAGTDAQGDLAEGGDA